MFLLSLCFNLSSRLMVCSQRMCPERAIFQTLIDRGLSRSLAFSLFLKESHWESRCLYEQDSLTTGCLIMHPCLGASPTEWLLEEGAPSSLTLQVKEEVRRWPVRSAAWRATAVSIRPQCQYPAGLCRMCQH